MVHNEDPGDMKDGPIYHIDRVGGWVVMRDCADI